MLTQALAEVEVSIQRRRQSRLQEQREVTSMLTRKFSMQLKALVRPVQSGRQSYSKLLLL
jgi:hypothetical protein